MAKIRVDAPSTISDGYELVFSAPCDYSEVDGLSVYYFGKSGKKMNSIFVFKDVFGNDLTDMNKLFTKGVYVKVILNVTEGVAYIQNAGTNKYIEEKLNNCVELSSLSQEVRTLILNEILVID